MVHSGNNETFNSLGSDDGVGVLLHKVLDKFNVAVFQVQNKGCLGGT